MAVDDDVRGADDQSAQAHSEMSAHKRNYILCQCLVATLEFLSFRLVTLISFFPLFARSLLVVCRRRRRRRHRRGSLAPSTI